MLFQHTRRQRHLPETGQCKRLASPAVPRRSALHVQALAGADEGTSGREEQARRAQERLRVSAPWDLLHMAAALDPEKLTPAAREAQQRSQRLSLQLGSASKERLLRAFLPASAVSAFTAADNTSEAATQQQENALMQVSSPLSCTS